MPEHRPNNRILICVLPEILFRMRKLFYSSAFVKASFRMKVGGMTYCVASYKSSELHGFKIIGLDKHRHRRSSHSTIQT